VIKFIGHETIPLDQLDTFPGNANIGDVPKILQSLAANGQYRSLIVREQDGGYTVLAGNHTKLAMVEHGAGTCVYERGRDSDQRPCQLCGDGPWDGAPRCEVFECSDEEATKINLADNRIGEFSKRDDDALADLLMSLEDLTGSGYTADDLRLYLPQEPPSLDDMAEEYGDVADEAEPVLPVLSFRVTSAVRDDFLELTERADDPSDPVSRFTYLLGKARG
jgi:hypothetical protein